MHLPYPTSPTSSYKSPLQKHILEAFEEGNGQPGFASSRGQEIRQREAHWGLFASWQDAGNKADLSTRSNSNARNRTAFQPQKRAKGTNSWQLKQFAEATLGSGSLRKVVQLPEGEDRDEWLAVNGRNTFEIRLRLGEGYMLTG